MCTLHCTHPYMRSHNGYHSPTINQNAKRWYFRSIPTTTLIKRGTNRESSFSWCLICIFFLKRLISILYEENGGLPSTSLIKRQMCPDMYIFKHKEYQLSVESQRFPLNGILSYEIWLIVQDHSYQKWGWHRSAYNRTLFSTKLVDLTKYVFW